MKAIILTIGDEILIGQIIDSNSAWIAAQLQLLNIEIIKIESISDKDEDIKEALGRSCEMADLVITTGGLGPTKDDITKHSIAEFLGVETYFDQGVYDNLAAMFRRYGREPGESHRLQAYMPNGVELLENKMGTAPGMLFRHSNTLIVSMPGVPYEMKYILEHSLTPILKELTAGISIYHKTIHVGGRGESQIADQIAYIVDAMPDYFKMAYLPSSGKVRLRLSGRHSDQEVLEIEGNKIIDQIVEELGDLIYGYDKDSLESAVKDRCIEKSIHIGLAESCTGGNIAKTLLSVPGASGYFLGGIVAYSNVIKQDLLGVKQATLEEFGAVSEQTVIEMAHGAIEKLNCDIAVSVSGIAGPGGGTPEKPVGTIHLCCANKNSYECRKLNLSKNRSVNIDFTTNAAMLMILKMVKSM